MFQYWIVSEEFLLICSNGFKWQLEWVPDGTKHFIWWWQWYVWEFKHHSGWYWLPARLGNLDDDRNGLPLCTFN